MYFRPLLIVSLIGCFALLVILFEHIYHYSLDLEFMRRVTVLEELLDSKLHCTFGIISSTVKICGTYRGRPVTFHSAITRGRYAKFTLMSARLPRQKMLLVSYPLVSENVRQMGEQLVYSIRDGFVSEPTVLGKAEAIRILDELVGAAEKCERQED